MVVTSGADDSVHPNNNKQIFFSKIDSKIQVLVLLDPQPLSLVPWPLAFGSHSSAFGSHFEKIKLNIPSCFEVSGINMFIMAIAIIIIIIAISSKHLPA